MNKIVHTFSAKRVLLPVIHPVSHQDALENARICADSGVSGVFLINQGMGAQDVLRLGVEIHESLGLWVGVNLLCFSPPSVLRAVQEHNRSFGGIWTDGAGVDHHGHAERQMELLAFRGARDEALWSGLYFGGVAFKHQAFVPNDRLSRAACIAEPYMDVVCTSGPATGIAADVERVRLMRNGLSIRGCLALASGVTEENVSDYLPYVDAFLVGTGLEKKFGVFDAKKVERLQLLVSN